MKVEMLKPTKQVLDSFQSNHNSLITIKFQNPKIRNGIYSMRLLITQHRCDFLRFDGSIWL